MNLSNIEINEQFAKAIKLMEEGENPVFITGRAGTGKSTLLEYFRATTKKEVVVLAPTGVAAVNISGQTIHSFFRFKPNITLDKAKKIAGKLRKFDDDEIYQKLGIIIIDEVSMVRADLLDCVDQFLRITRKRHGTPFGGAKMIFIGDLYQLPPVVTSSEREIFAHHYKSPYFFSAHVFPQISLEFIELEKIYRQRDDKFIQILNSIRNNSVADAEINTLNRRFDPKFEPSHEFYVYLATINAKAAEINSERLSRLKAKEKIFDGFVDGEFETNALPTDVELKLKVGAQVMLLNNDSLFRWVNGTIGKVVNIGEDEISVELPNGNVEDVGLYKWEMFEYSLDKTKQTITSKKAGSFTQIPVKLAWAITIHKSQGKTFDRIILDLERGTFAAGQAYVALSRCRTLEGIVLKYKFQKRHVIVDWRIVKFLTEFQYNISEKNVPLEEKMNILRDAIENNKKLKITYLKAQDVKSRRVVQPMELGTMEYLGKEFLGIKCYCHTRKEGRTFRVDRILEMEIA